MRGAQKLDWLVVEEITQLDMALWADLAAAGRLLGLEHSQLIRDLAGGRRHELTENMRSNPGIFNFVKWLQVGKEACPTLGVGRKAHAHPFGPVVLEVAGLPQHLHVHLAHQRALMGVLYGHENPPLGIGLNVQPKCKLHCEVRLFISRRKNPVR